MSILISSHRGHFVGKAGKIEKNPYKIWEDSLGKYVEMFVNQDMSGMSFYFDYDDLNKVSVFKTKKLTWNFVRNHRVSHRNVYYVSAHTENTTIRIHQLIMGHKPNFTIDHIDRNPLNNRKHNLRFATSSDQVRNTCKRSRKRHSHELPDEIKQIEIPKYVHYVYLKRNKTDCFRIECHPAQNNSMWESSTSIKLSILDKFKQTIEKLEEFNQILNKQHTL
jgi:hypothetical protein